MRPTLPLRLGLAAGLAAVLLATAFVLVVLRLGTPGLVVSTLALLALTAYLLRSIVLPLRSVTAAAAELGANLRAEQAQTEAALRALAGEKRRIETFHRAGERLAAARDLSELATIALAELAFASGAGRGALWAVEPDDQRELVLEAALGVDAAQLPRVVHADETPAGRAIASREVVAVEVDGRAELHLPLVVGGRVLGLLSLVRLDATPFAGEERDTLVRLAEQASVALSNAISYRSALRTARVNRAVLDATPDPVGLFGLDGSLLAHNAAMAEVRHHRGIEEATGDQAGEQRGLLTLGERTYSRFVGPVRDETGEQMGRLVVLRDVTRERESEKLKDEFFALVSHELRTPLTSIIGYLELARDEDEDLSPDARRFLGVVDRNAKRLLRLVGDMLFVAQVEAGRLSLERAPLDLGEVVADAVEAARPAAERAAVGLRLEAEPVGLIDGDRDRVGQLVDNLVSNALKFTQEYGEVVVSLGPGAGGWPEVAVRDDGMGIPDAEQQHLFERFFRSSTATTRAVPGAGLGLTICKTIVEAHEGEIAVESTEGLGTTVRVRLPLSAAAARAGAPA